MSKLPNNYAELVRLIRAQIDARDYVAARERIDSLLAEDGLDAARFGTLTALLLELGDHDAAVETLDRGVLATGAPFLRLQRALLLPDVPSSAAHAEACWEECCRRVAELADTRLRLPQPLLQITRMLQFRSAYYNVDDRWLAETLAQIYLKWNSGLGAVAPHCRRPQDHTRRPPRLMIMLVGQAGLGANTVALNKLVRAMTQSRFDVVVATVGNMNDPVSLQTVLDCSWQIQVPGSSLVQARQLVALAEPDIIVFSEIGMDPLFYFLGMARLAPVQAALHGHIATSGLPNMDLFLSWDGREPNGAERYYSERLVRMPGVPEPTLPPVARFVDRMGLIRALCVPPDSRLYLLPHSPHKLHPDLDVLLKRILDRDSKAVIICFDDHKRQRGRRYKQRLVPALGGVAGRVRWIETLPPDRFLGLLELVDVVLDCLYFSAGSTAFYVVASGTPMVTLPGWHARGRMATALYRHIGVTDMVACNPDHYVELAVRIANDAVLNADFRRRCVDGARVGDTPAAVAFLEDVFAEALDRAQRGS